jgi:hypothetical protein
VHVGPSEKQVACQREISPGDAIKPASAPDGPQICWAGVTAHGILYRRTVIYSANWPQPKRPGRAARVLRASIRQETTCATCSRPARWHTCVIGLNCFRISEGSPQPERSNARGNSHFQRNRIRNCWLAVAYSGNVHPCGRLCGRSAAARLAMSVNYRGVGVLFAQIARRDSRMWWFLVCFARLATLGRCFAALGTTVAWSAHKATNTRQATTTRKATDKFITVIDCRVSCYRSPSLGDDAKAWRLPLWPPPRSCHETTQETSWFYTCRIVGGDHYHRHSVLLATSGRASGASGCPPTGLRQPAASTRHCFPYVCPIEPWKNTSEQHGGVAHGFHLVIRHSSVP